MSKNDINEWRKTRLGELSDKLGGDTELGKALGYRDGAYVGQMRKGLRPISEKTVQKIHSLRGCAGWFDQPMLQMQIDDETIDMIKRYAYLLSHASPEVRRQAHSASIEALLGFLSENAPRIPSGSNREPI